MTTTTRGKKLPEAGEVFWVDLGPDVGTEQTGRRPILVLSDRRLHAVSRRSLVCPITSNLKPWPTKVLLPPGCVVTGAALVDQARMIDREARALRYAGRLPEDVTALVIELLMAFMGRETVPVQR